MVRDGSFTPLKINVWLMSLQVISALHFIPVKELNEMALFIFLRYRNRF